MQYGPHYMHSIIVVVLAKINLGIKSDHFWLIKEEVFVL